ncbi:hypothetical protein FPE01S_01_16610 [Flavihumibacter petaseus NBRC 106054]|uniref:Sialate O-acetylesterase domain-containing protein n=2 Tax=Flavihumibacter TaxID=1004301 RepID=A0A0E9MZ33_9BACT|nr:hypothetical protein FPE01S_01_16610 [Flavihumibacter petaseus NBRC 106054]
MVLQRDKPIIISGSGRPGESIGITWRGNSYKTKSGENGKFSLTLPASASGGPYTLTVTSGTSGQASLTFHDILIGEVWICAGQSNMVLPMDRVREMYPDELEGASWPLIRFYTVPIQAGLTGPMPELPAASWKVVNRSNIPSLSATAYFFSRTLFKKLNIPVGVIITAVGGTPIEAWMPATSLTAFPDAAKQISDNLDTSTLFQQIRSIQEKTALQEQQRRATDSGLSGSQPWFMPSIADSGWASIQVPGFWEDLGIPATDGVIWFRKDLMLPQEQADLPAKLYLGRIVDADEVWVNGTLVGSTGYQYPPRRYTIPAGLLQSGTNSICVRITNHQLKGGFAPGKSYYLLAGKDSIRLEGAWKYKIALRFSATELIPDPVRPQYQPAALYNGLIAPLGNWPVRGFLWYQGESNVGKADTYRNLFPAMITSWRQQWHDSLLPFVYVQLPNYRDAYAAPETNAWAELRAAQAAALSLPRTAMITTIDAGDSNDLHPLNKSTVGERLALAALNITYGKNTVFTGPRASTVIVAGKKIRILFEKLHTGLVSADGLPPRCFEIAGSDKSFRPAIARINGNEIILEKQDKGDVSDIRYVRYAWSDNPPVNLTNKAGLPATPFFLNTTKSK